MSDIPYDIESDDFTSPVGPPRISVHTDPLGLSSKSSSAVTSPSADALNESSIHERKPTKVVLEGIVALLVNHEYKTVLEYLRDVLPTLKEEPYEYLLVFTVRIYCRLCLKDAKGIQEDFQSLGSLDSFVWQFESYPSLYQELSGSMVPFVLRLYLAAYSCVCDTPTYSFDDLYELVRSCCLTYDAFLQASRGIAALDSATKLDMAEGKSESIKEKLKACMNNLTLTAHLLAEVLWQKGFPAMVLYYMNRDEFKYCLLFSWLKDKEALELLKREVLSRRPQYYPTLSLMGRIHLWMGDIDTAREYFALVECLCNHGTLIVQQNAALLAVTKNDYVNALRKFEETIYLGEDYGKYANSPLPGSSRRALPLAHSPTAIAIATNNACVTLVYNTNSSAAIYQLSNYFLRDIQEPLYETALKNLLRLYEFSNEKVPQIQRLTNFVNTNMKEDTALQSCLLQNNN